MGYFSPVFPGYLPMVINPLLTLTFRDRHADKSLTVEGAADDSPFFLNRFLLMPFVLTLGLGVKFESFLQDLFMRGASESWCMAGAKRSGRPIYYQSSCYVTL